MEFSEGSMHRGKCGEGGTEEGRPEAAQSLK